jgi:glc operon protein GlcG
MKKMIASEEGILKLAEANRAIAAALAKARELSADISVSVCDPYGHLLAHQRMDTVLGEAIRQSIGKAVAAGESASPSGENLDENVEHPLTEMVVGQGVPDIRRRGGLPIIRKGKLEGAIGVSGARTYEHDEECARAGVEAITGEENRISGRVAFH